MIVIILAEAGQALGQYFNTFFNRATSFTCDMWHYLLYTFLTILHAMLRLVSIYDFERENAKFNANIDKVSMLATM